MEVTRLSSDGQVIIPMSLWLAHQWKPGQELVAIDTADGILLQAKPPFSPTTLDEVAGCLRYDGPPKSLEEFDRAIAQTLKEQGP